MNEIKCSVVKCQFADTLCTLMLLNVSVVSCVCVWIFIAGATFAYDGQKPLFVDLDFGIDMASRSEYSVLISVNYVLMLKFS